MGPSRLVVTRASASAGSSACALSFSKRMMPALLMRTFNAGCRAANSAAKERMLAGSPMSSVSEVMPGFAAVVWSSACWRRPAMMTWFPSAWKASARPRPMPEPPPVIRIVLPVVLMETSLFQYHGPASQFQLVLVDHLVRKEVLCELQLADLGIEFDLVLPRNLVAAREKIQNHRPLVVHQNFHAGRLHILLALAFDRRAILQLRAQVVGVAMDHAAGHAVHRDRVMVFIHRRRIQLVRDQLRRTHRQRAHPPQCQRRHLAGIRTPTVIGPTPRAAHAVPSHSGKSNAYPADPDARLCHASPRLPELARSIRRRRHGLRPRRLREHLPRFLHGPFRDQLVLPDLRPGRHCRAAGGNQYDPGTRRSFRHQFVKRVPSSAGCRTSSPPSAWPF